MLDDSDRKKIIDAIALLEQVLRATDNTIKSAAMLRAIEAAGHQEPGPAATGGTTEGGGDFGLEDTRRWQRKP